MHPLPNFENDEALADWIDTHDTAAFIDKLEDADMPFPVTRSSFPTRPIDIRMRSDHLAAIEKIAAQRGISYQMLVREWLIDKLRQEAPDLLPV